ncbi:MAG: hypothetical protein Fur0044_36180 [Anaerolineae bacterium]
MSQPNYNSGKIRELLNAAFTPDELRQLCYDEFRPVYDKLADKEGKPGIIQSLIEFCERRLQMEQLLVAIKKRAPEQYAHFVVEQGMDERKVASPSNEEARFLQEMINLKTRSLNHLQLQAAKYGSLSVPSHIALEIEDLQKEITDLRQQLNANG